jgi:hypothetical protein
VGLSNVRAVNALILSKAWTCAGSINYDAKIPSIAKLEHDFNPAMKNSSVQLEFQKVNAAAHFSERGNIIPDTII